MEHYLGIFVRAVFIENMALTFFLGMCNHGGSLLHHQPADGGTLTTVILPRERC